MNKSPREQALMMAFPAFAVIAVYLYWFHFPAETAIEKADKELKALRAQGDPAILMQKALQVQRAQDRKVKLLAEKERLGHEWKAMIGSTNGAAQRQRRIERFVILLQEHRLRVVEQAPAERDRNLPKVLDEVGKRLGEGQGQAPQVWTFRIVGRYANLKNALQELSEGEPLVIPLGVSMKEAELGTTVREWTLLVWI